MTRTLNNKKNNVEDKDITFEDKFICFTLEYRYKGKIVEKLIPVEGDYEIMRLFWPRINSAEESELE